MALINCRECSSQVSDQAQSCNKCAFPLNKISLPKVEPAETPRVSMEEKQLWKGSPSPIYSLGAYIVTGIISLFSLINTFVVGFGWSIFLLVGLGAWYIISRELDSWKIEITDQRIIVKKGWLSSKTDELELFRVKDIRLEEPLLLKSFGLSNIVLITSDKTNKIETIPAIKGGEALREKIRNAVDKRRDLKKVREFDER